ncbi:MAG: phosphodiester glycosidase family protein, partial [candidate division KSB1 bacterium]|nr:phosphodiester glycosidase family protein [candidate division KSB1 bacterium]
YSEGMSLVELAEFLVDLGAFLAINFDGGGSTTMVIQGKVVNRPAGDGQERPVSNALVVRYKAWEEP